jgi:hypothetical protein
MPIHEEPSTQHTHVPERLHHGHGAHPSRTRSVRHATTARPETHQNLIHPDKRTLDPATCRSDRLQRAPLIWNACPRTGHGPARDRELFASLRHWGRGLASAS